MVPSELYPFATGDRLTDRNTYFYVPFGGDAFLAGWRASRDEAMAELGAPEELVLHGRGTVTAPPFDTCTAVTALYARLVSDPEDAAAHELARQLLRRFEVTKRIYSGYNAAFRAEAGAVYDDLTLYVALAHVLAAAYDATRGFNFLSGLLKINDTITAMRHQVPPGAKAAVSALLHRERGYVDDVARRQGLGR